jgi:hypothetical protein
MFTVDSGVTLILDNIILLGRTSNTNSLVDVYSGGMLIMNNGSTITDNSNNNWGGGSRSDGVYVSGGTFTMNGGTISCARQGGVYVFSSGTFTMNGGTISRSDWPYTTEDMAVYVDSGIFFMNGGTISGHDYGGVTVMEDGNFTMSGGTISDNRDSGGTGGGGVKVNGTFTMSGGDIYGNSGSGGGGGGVCVFDSGTFTMEGGKISGNTTSYGGGGVCVWGGTFAMSDGEISGNTASYGGGVYVTRYIDNYNGINQNGTFTKTGGTIYGYSTNDAVNSNMIIGTVANDGAAVYVDSSPVKRRETTAGPSVNLDSSKSGTAGGWEN